MKTFIISIFIAMTIGALANAADFNEFTTARCVNVTNEVHSNTKLNFTGDMGSFLTFLAVGNADVLQMIEDKKLSYFDEKAPSIISEGRALLRYGWEKMSNYERAYACIYMAQSAPQCFDKVLSASAYVTTDSSQLADALETTSCQLTGLRNYLSTRTDDIFARPATELDRLNSQLSIDKGAVRAYKSYMGIKK